MNILRPPHLEGQDAYVAAPTPHAPAATAATDGERAARYAVRLGAEMGEAFGVGLLQAASIPGIRLTYKRDLSMYISSS